jgi:tRNA (mo5U34)-methyltransferase
MNYSELFATLEQAGFGDWVSELQGMATNWFSERHHGDYRRWAQAFEQLPAVDDLVMSFDQSAVTVQGHCADRNALDAALKILRPWRKGPYRIADVFIDTEWRSDFKWDRVAPHLSDLKGRRILDVGCGNGYHAWRMLASNPKLVLGIDPSVLFNLQFQALQFYARDPRVYMLPLTIQQMPDNMAWFDTVFSMGVLYHRRSPFDHLMQLKSLLRPGGELCLETLIIEGGPGQILVPDSRYARMNNVWFLPSAQELAHWLERIGFSDVRVVDINRTRVQEQRSTDWMPFESLPECLDPDNPLLTVEGYPAPMRAVLLANR